MLCDSLASSRSERAFHVLSQRPTALDCGVDGNAKAFLSLATVNENKTITRKLKNLNEDVDAKARFYTL